MRNLIVAILVTAFLATSASAGITAPKDGAGAQDDCKRNNAAAPGSCVALLSGAAADKACEDKRTCLVLYVDTGRADGRPGIWQENNTWGGLQKGEFNRNGATIPGDLEILQ